MSIRHRFASAPASRLQPACLHPARIAGLLALLLGACTAAPRPHAAPAPAPASASAAAAAAPSVLPSAPAPAALQAAARAHPQAFLDRIGWGADAAQLRRLRELGAVRMLDAQLDAAPHPALPPALARRLAELPVNQPLQVLMPPLVAERRALQRMRHDADPADAAQARQLQRTLHAHLLALTRQAMAQQLLLAACAPDSLRQRLTWFWMNHFNVFHNAMVGPMLADYQRRVIAPHALGHFRDLLQATMFSPQMLLYLNNAQNRRGHINENYARELMELHTLGVGAGYTQADVTNLAHVLTGLGVDLAGRPPRVRPALRGLLWQHGLVVFNPARHDPQPEVVLGRTLQGRGVGELEQVVDLLADDPATARHVSLELATYFVADHPDPAMVAAMVRTWRRTDGDIAAVLRTMFTSRSFAASLAQPQFKDPMRYLLSAVRVSFDGRLLRNPQPLLGMLYELGEPLDGRTTPDGYALAGGSWDSAGQLGTRFRVAQQLGAGAPALFAAPPPYWPDVAPQAPRRPPRSVPELAHGAVFEAAAPTLHPATLQVLASAGARWRWNALWLASPDFMNR